VTDLAPLVPLAAEVVSEGTRRKLTLATAESCTGGLVAAALTEIAGSSAVVERAFVTYSNRAKTEMLGVAPALLEAKGAVSKEVAIAMAEGALAHAPADVAVAITGVAGPSGGSASRPVGLVHLAAARRGGPTRHVERRFPNDGRSAIRLAATKEALRLLRELLSAG
jgi:nicotinamide-nucleotide amidase